MKRKQGAWLALLLALGMTLPASARPVSVEDGASLPDADYSSINDGIRIGDNARVGDLDTVNGSIRVGTGSRTGRIESVNGTVEVSDGTEIAAIRTVNGGIELEREVLVKSDLRSVNGPINSRGGSRIAGNIETVNGEMTLEGTVVDGGLETYHGRIELIDTEVAGDLRVRKPRGVSSWFGREQPTVVVIGPGSVVHGDLYFEKKVRLEVDESAKIGEIHAQAEVERVGGYK